ncbi:(Fe-S)-binding protein [Brevibacillus borstelensis]|uniref:(Fe-S)-binding protein n=1 Tax=Brevibacillus borstelensis TaxID=45462 RepID=UPI00148F45B3|nr:(Fe-S)-binding protein [Brevibacillus borstelensis]MCM3469040.1 (Fe-S)-binding protein [Brevibacillus borstelensis]MCM3558476.1 (Fe-S)-binding protein [Brevibacillus borstelensis]MCM3621428.1 (Fe-S)-binding protein [Brevibacillus borstelensis]NOU57812.1 (Fe-S)-binding protein [Brevibacillus borstelensis]
MSKTTSQELLSKFNMDEIMNCMHCGFCLPACPTYRETGLESHSPRGRIALMKGVATSQLSVDPEFEKNMYACLGCRACETACPAGVPYGSLVETAREVVEDNKKSEAKPPFLRQLVFDKVFPYPERMQALGTALWAAQSAGLQTLANKTGLINILPRELAEMQQAVDKIASPRERKQREKVMKAEGKAALKIGMFTGCIMDVMFFETNQATARLLTKAGCEVVFVENQVCCGALHAHAGEKEGAVELAKRNMEAFERAGVDFVVNNAGGCGTALKEYHHWFHDDPEWKERAMAFVSKVRDANELLAELPTLTFSKPLNVRVTYQDSCHLAHGQGVRNQPRQLLRSIPGVELIEMTGADSCCGSAGIYNITNFDMSMQILDGKMEHVKETKARVIVTSNPGCLLQMKKGIMRAGLEGQMEAVHIMDLLARAL